MVDVGWFSAAPYLTNERSHHMLQLLSAKDKAEHVLDDVLKHFRYGRTNHTSVGRNPRRGPIGLVKRIPVLCKACTQCTTADSVVFPTVINETMSSEARGHRRLWPIYKVKGAARVRCSRSFSKILFLSIICVASSTPSSQGLRYQSLASRALKLRNKMPRL